MINLLLAIGVHLENLKTIVGKHVLRVEGAGNGETEKTVYQNSNGIQPEGVNTSQINNNQFQIQIEDEGNFYDSHSSGAASECHGISFEDCYDDNNQENLKINFSFDVDNEDLSTTDIFSENLPSFLIIFDLNSTLVAQPHVKSDSAHGDWRVQEDNLENTPTLFPLLVADQLEGRDQQEDSGKILLYEEDCAAEAENEDAEQDAAISNASCLLEVGVIMAFTSIFLFLQIIHYIFLFEKISPFNHEYVPM